jgi:hypothetical protein
MASCPRQSYLSKSRLLVKGKLSKSRQVVQVKDEEDEEDTGDGLKPLEKLLEGRLGQ